MFVALLNACLETFSELPAQMLGRPILKKQTRFSFYRPSATVIANTVADIPFSFIRITIYNIIIYFMANLDRSPGAFFTFELLVCGIAQSSQSATDGSRLVVHRILDHARFLPYIRSDVLELRRCFPYFGVLRTEHDSVRWLHDSRRSDEEMALLDRKSSLAHAIF